MLMFPRLNQLGYDCYPHGKIQYYKNLFFKIFLYKIVLGSFDFLYPGGALKLNENKLIVYH